MPIGLLMWTQEGRIAYDHRLVAYLHGWLSEEEINDLLGSLKPSRAITLSFWMSRQLDAEMGEAHEHGPIN